MVIHLIHYPVSAKHFVAPLVKALNSNGIEAELWLENRPELTYFTKSIDCPKKYITFDISLNPIASLIKLIRLIKKIKKNSPAAIHTHQSRASLIPLFAAKIARVPIRIYHNHGTPYLGYKGILRFLLWSLEYINCKLATNVITVSKSTHKKMIEDRIVNESKCVVLGQGSVCGIDLNEFTLESFDESHKSSCREELGIETDDYVVFYVGRPYKRKGFHCLLRAWESMPQKGNTLLMTGCTEQDVVAVAGTHLKGIKALGYIKDISSGYAACDVVVLPSHHEGLPNSLLEAAAASRPLVGCDVTGIDSVIIDKTNGLLIPIESPEKLAEKLLYLKKNPELRQKMGAHGREMVKRCFSRKFCNENLLEYYDALGIKS